VLGVSRKSFIGNLTGVSSPDNRLIGSVSLGLINAIKGVNILRVHDVIETNEALKVIDVF
jgi:dihydropteroate synthase